MSVAVVVPPAVPAVDLKTALQHLRVDHGSEDPYITGLCHVGTLLAEKWLGRALITQTLQMTVDGFWAEPLPLRQPPIGTAGVTSVGYDDIAGVATVLPPETYRLIGAPDASLALAYGAAWPATISGTGTVRIVYVAGYGDAPADVPAPIRQAILLFVGHHFANREAVVLGQAPAELPIAAASLISSYRIPTM